MEEIEEPMAEKPQEKQKLGKNGKEEEEEVLKVCDWKSYGKNCRQITNGSLCKKHQILIKDYKIIKETKRCSTKIDVKFTPRSKEQLTHFLKEMNYDENTISVDICLSNGIMENGNIESEDFIEVDDGTRYYYEADSSTRGLHKVKEIKLFFIKHCNNKAIVEMDDEMFCEQCYIILAKKHNHPKIKTLRASRAPDEVGQAQQI